MILWIQTIQTIQSFDPIGLQCLLAAVVLLFNYKTLQDFNQIFRALIEDTSFCGGFEMIGIFPMVMECGGGSLSREHGSSWRKPVHLASLSAN